MRQKHGAYNASRLRFDERRRDSGSARCMQLCSCCIQRAQPNQLSEGPMNTGSSLPSRDTADVSSTSSTANAAVSPIPIDSVAGAGRADVASQAARAMLGLREMLLRGEFARGERISELPLVGRLGMSRTPIRLALERLAHMGLLEAGSAGGFVVRGFAISDVYDAIELRGILEGAAARLAAERLRREQQHFRLPNRLCCRVDRTRAPRPSAGPLRDGRRRRARRARRGASRGTRLRPRTQGAPRVRRGTSARLRRP